MGRSVPRAKLPLRHAAPRHRSHRILAELRERILSWYYAPGHHLGEQDLCDEFSASRVPVREALNSLAQQGLVNRIPNQGCYVKQPDISEIHDLYDLRLALELFVVERLARSKVPSDFVRAQKELWSPFLHIRANESLTSADLLRADESFHLGLAAALGNRYILDELTNLNGRLQIVRLAVVTSPHRVQETAGAHLAILDAIVARDPEKARRALWNNINQARNKVEMAVTQAAAAAVWRSQAGRQAVAAAAANSAG